MALAYRPTAVELLEAVAVVLFHGAARRVGIQLDDDVRVDPYALTLDRNRWEAEALFKDSGLTLDAARTRSGDLANLWLDGLRRVSAHAS